MAITSHMCAYFNVILKANREYTGGIWSYYDANHRQKAEATLNKDWSAIDTTHRPFNKIVHHQCCSCL